LITKETAKTLKSLEGNINYFQVSLYGIDKPSYNSVTKNPESFQLVLKGIENLIESEMKPVIFWVLTKDNLSELEKAYKLTSELGLSELRISPKLHLGRGKTDCEFASNESVETWRETVDAFQRLNNFVKTSGSPKVVLHARPLLGEYLYHLTGLPYFFVTCKAATTMIYVDSDGNCSPCPFSAHMPDLYNPLNKKPVLMNILEHEFNKIWNSDVFRLYRQLQNPSANPKEIFVNCPHFKSGMCDPCVFTPCTCRSSIKMISDALATREQMYTLRE
jgi:MoaA/NifB/PqqE/SkfB family radical SAM enzyme